MKKFFIVVFLLITLISCSSSSTSTGEIGNDAATKSVPGKNGRFFTAFGKVNALFLFIQFDDDSTTKSDAWSYDTTRLPDWAVNFVNSENDNNFSNNNLSQYFHEMSSGNFELRGYVYPRLIRPNFPTTHYKNILEVNSEILESIDDEIDYSEFDNWKYVREREFENVPDGKVDLIFLIYRNFPDELFFNNGWTGSADLYLLKDIQTKDGVLIKKGQMKSGLQMRGGIHGMEYLKYVSAHEFGHFLFGPVHIEGISNLCLMTGGPVWNASRGMISWEKEQLGWIRYTEVDTLADKIYTLTDYMTTGQVLRAVISQNEYFLIENRNKKSIHDWAGDNGIYIYHCRRGISSTPIIDVLCADGSWKFELDKENKTLRRDTPDKNGKNEMNFTQYYGKTKFACYEPMYEDNSAWGDEYDAFDLVYNNVLSPVSNPSSSNQANKKFTVEVVEIENGICKLKIFFNDIYGGSPSKPQELKVTIGDDSIPMLEWLHNEEPDLKGYNIYRIAGDPISGNRQKIGFANKEQFKAVKLMIWFDKEFGKNREKNIFYYAVSAIDNDENESVLSDAVLLK